jgi:Na+/H+-dicarboxylate symporter
MKLWQKVTIGLIFGIIFGSSCSDYVDYVRPVGDLFIKLIKMIIVPLIFFAITGGMTSVSDSRLLGRLGIKAAIFYVCTTCFAIFIGFATAWMIRPGEGLTLNFGQGKSIPASNESVLNKILTLFANIIPDNAIGAMAEGTVLQVVFFAVFTGITIHHLPDEQRSKVSEFFQLMSNIVFKMVHLIILLSPYAAFALTAWVVGSQGISVLQSLVKLIVALLVACGVQYGVFGVLIMIFARLSPFPFYRKSIEYQAIAFSTSSSKAALATTIRVAQEKLGISKPSSSFVLPLGAAINMDGMAIYLGLCAIFFAQALGRELSIHDYAIIMLTSTLGSIGGAGIPGGSMVMLPMVLTSIGLPIEGIALIAGVDRILDMLRTTVNITGDVAVTLCVDSSEGRLDRNIYYDLTKTEDVEI